MHSCMDSWSRVTSNSRTFDASVMAPCIRHGCQRWGMRSNGMPKRARTKQDSGWLRCTTAPCCGLILLYSISRWTNYNLATSWFSLTLEYFGYMWTKILSYVWSSHVFPWTNRCDFLGMMKHRVLPRFISCECCESRQKLWWILSYRCTWQAHLHIISYHTYTLCIFDLKIFASSILSYLSTSQRSDLPMWHQGQPRMNVCRKPFERSWRTPNW